MSLPGWLADSNPGPCGPKPDTLPTGLSELALRHLFRKNVLLIVYGQYTYFEPFTTLFFENVGVSHNTGSTVSAL